MKIGMISLGCAKNLVVSEQMLYKLREGGHEIVADEKQAEIIVVNTCGFIEDAQQEAINTILETAELKKSAALKKLIVTGCLSELFREQIAEEMPEVDAVVGVGSCDNIVDIINIAMQGERPCDFASNSGPVSETPRIISTGSVWAYVLIAEGCDNFCSYCLIPKIRGRFRSRSMENVLKEARELAEAGYKELILVAQDLTRYGTDLYGGPSLAKLLRELCKIDGVEWIRLHYLYPNEIDEELIEVVASEDKIVKYIDMPIQHINENILKKMNRRDTSEGIKNVISMLRRRIEGLVLRTSIITGFPGEGEDEFAELCEFLREQKIERAGVFPFSPQEGTPAAKMEHVGEAEARRRAAVVMDIQARIMDDWEQSLVGKTVPVICEKVGPRTGMNYGRAYFDSPGVDGSVVFDGKCAEGQIANVRIESSNDGELTGVMV